MTRRNRDAYGFRAHEAADDEPTEWMAQGLCRTEAVGDPVAWTNLWFPTKQGPGVGAFGRAICRRCPVRRECGEYAIARPELRGTWGATTVTDRANIRGTREGRKWSRYKLSEDGWFFLFSVK
jgi:WhiB family redox-sensing transcriptional regulator